MRHEARAGLLLLRIRAAAGRLEAGGELHVVARALDREAVDVVAQLLQADERALGIARRLLGADDAGQGVANAAGTLRARASASSSRVSAMSAWPVASS